MMRHREVRRIYIQSLLVYNKCKQNAIVHKNMCHPTVTPTQDICFKDHFRGPVTFTPLSELLADCQESLPLKKTYVCYSHGFELPTFFTRGSTLIPTVPYL